MVAQVDSHFSPASTTEPVVNYHAFNGGLTPGTVSSSRSFSSLITRPVITSVLSLVQNLQTRVHVTSAVSRSEVFTSGPLDPDYRLDSGVTSQVNAFVVGLLNRAHDWSSLVVSVSPGSHGRTTCTSLKPSLGAPVLSPVSSGTSSPTSGLDSHERLDPSPVLTSHSATFNVFGFYAVVGVNLSTASDSWLVSVNDSHFSISPDSFGVGVVNFRD